MASKPAPTPVSQLIEAGDLIINDGYRAKNSELSAEGFPFARAQNINNGFHFDGADCFPEEDISKVGIKISQPGDAVFTSKGTVGRFAFVRKGTPRFVYAPQLCFWRSLNHAKLYPRWLYYWMQSREFFVQYSGVAGQTDMAQYVSLSDQRRMYITIPPLKEQQAIACILGALDDKIELNRRMNETLEAMARAIFKSWFVDFDPVRAKAAGQQPPGLAPHIAELFPDGIEDSELGEIPRGWHIRPIGDVVKVLGGGTPSTKNPTYWEVGVHPFCTPKDMSSLPSPVLLGTERHLTDDGLAKVSSGQLPKGTVLLSSRAPIGYLAVAETPVSVNQGIIAMVCDGELPNLYVLQWTYANMEQIIANANGSTFLEISKRDFRLIKTLVPPKLVLEEFMRLAGSIHQRLVSNLRQVLNLAYIRDTLLPKLISGELRLPDAERIVGRCA